MLQKCTDNIQSIVSDNNSYKHVILTYYLHVVLFLNNSPTIFLLRMCLLIFFSFVFHRHRTSLICTISMQERCIIFFIVINITSTKLRRVSMQIQTSISFETPLCQAELHAEIYGNYAYIFAFTGIFSHLSSINVV